MNSKLFDRIPREKMERYLDGTLDERETAMIDDLLNTDRDLQILVDEYVNMQMFINNSTLEESRKHTRTRSLRPLWITLAAAACLAGIVFSVVRPAHDNEVNVIPKPDMSTVFRGDNTAFDPHTDTVVPLPQE